MTMLASPVMVISIRRWKGDTIIIDSYALFLPAKTSLTQHSAATNRRTYRALIGGGIPQPSVMEISFHQTCLSSEFPAQKHDFAVHTGHDESGFSQYMHTHARAPSLWTG